MLYYMAEEDYRAFPWFQRSLKSLQATARKKRMEVREIDSVEAISPEDDAAALVLLGSSEHWMECCIAAADARNVRPIVLSNRYKRVSAAAYSTVTMDIYATMNLAIDYMRGIGCRSLALYAVNPASTSDPFRRETFLGLGGGAPEDVFTLTGSFSSLFQEFRARMDSYEGVICTNDYAAASLLQNLRRSDVPRERWPKVIGFGNLDISSFFRPTITSISDDYEHFGDAALAIYRMVMRDKYVSSVDVTLGSGLIVRESTGNLSPASPGNSFRPASEDRENLFFQDGDINRLRRIELLFNQCDDLDLEILRHLQKDRPYAAIAELSYVSETAVKYRIRNMCAVCGASSRAELQELLLGVI